MEIRRRKQNKTNNAHTTQEKKEKRNEISKCWNDSLSEMIKLKGKTHTYAHPIFIQIREREKMDYSTEFYDISFVSFRIN